MTLLTATLAGSVTKMPNTADVSTSASRAPRPSMSLRARHAAATRQRIIDAATRLFVEHGYVATTIDHIAAAADISPRTFFRYFPTKEDVLFHDVDERIARFQEMLSERPSDEPSPAALVHVLCAMVEQIDNTPHLELIVKVKTDGLGEHDIKRAAVEHTGMQLVLATLAARANTTPDDLALRATTAAVMACFDIALKDWIDTNPRGRFRDVFDATLTACAHHLPTGCVTQN